MLKLKKSEWQIKQLDGITYAENTLEVNWIFHLMKELMDFLDLVAYSPIHGYSRNLWNKLDRLRPMIGKIYSIYSVEDYVPDNATCDKARGMLKALDMELKKHIRRYYEILHVTDLAEPNQP